MFLPEFVSALKDVKNLCIFKEYPAREKPSAGLSAHDLYLELKKYNQNIKSSFNRTHILEQKCFCPNSYRH